ncbi:alpha-L-fucosidase, partial [bacterium]
FLHWGIYSVKGVTESWSFFNGEIPYEEYMAQLDGFTAERYDPEAWADRFQRAGATYAILTTKHHDGVALWDTHLSDLNVAKRTPAGRDLVGPFVEALRKRGMKVGLYFSHLDWSEPTHASLPTSGVYHGPKDDSPHCSPADGVAKPEVWERFLAFHRGQLKELCDRYQPDILWFDGDWERTPEQWRFAELRDQLHEWCPNVILNSRMGGFGDYDTPEQGVPLVAPEGPWEFCMTLNDSWGYQAGDANHKSTRQLVRTFLETVGMGGNLLLGIGPHADGTLQPTQEERLEEIGEWLDLHREAVFGTGAGLPPGHHYGPSTLSEDGRTLYLVLLDPPQ